MYWSALAVLHKSRSVLSLGVILYRDLLVEGCDSASRLFFLRNTAASGKDRLPNSFSVNKFLCYVNKGSNVTPVGFWLGFSVVGLFAD